jgi:hypothetical protein
MGLMGRFSNFGASKFAAWVTGVLEFKNSIQQNEGNTLVCAAVQSSLRM